MLSKKKTSRQKFFRRSPKKKVFIKIFQAISKKKRSLQKFFRRPSQKNVFQKIFQALLIILTIQKIMLSSSQGQANFRGLEAKDVLEDSTSGNHQCQSNHVRCPLVAKFCKTNHCIQFVVTINVGLDTNFTQINQQ